MNHSHPAWSRRRFLKFVVAAGAATGTSRLLEGSSLAGSGGSGQAHAELLELTATEAVAAIKAGEIKAETYTVALLSRANSLKFLNTLISQNAEQVLEAARAVDKRRAAGGQLGPLAGLPLLIKDSINTAALPTTAGTPALLNNRPTQDAPLLVPLFQAGGVLFGKTNMHELAFGATSVNAFFGPVRNPYDPSRISGGSSGGTAAAIAAQIGTAGLGGDTAGSVRIPAALCGIAGLRPTVGRYPSPKPPLLSGPGPAGTGQPNTTAVVPISNTRDSIGPMGRSVADVALLDSVIMGTPPLGPIDLAGLRLGVARGNFFSKFALFGELGAEVERLVNDALERLTDAGVVLVEGDIPGLEALVQTASFPIMLREVFFDLPTYLAANDPSVSFSDLIDAIASPDVKQIFLGAVVEETAQGLVPRVSLPTYLGALDARRQLQEVYADHFRAFGIDALVFPTTVLPTIPISQANAMIGQPPVSVIQAYIFNTDPGSTAGLPGLTLPIGLTRGDLPVGLEIDGLMGSDRTLLRIGMAMEGIFGRLPAPQPQQMRGLQVRPPLPTSLGSTR